MISNPFNITNKKWFINLTDGNIPNNISTLLQRGGGGGNFCLPANFNKKLVIRELIRDSKNNGNKHNAIHLASVIQSFTRVYLEKEFL